MHCKFLHHGLAIGYDSLIKPCCTFKIDKKHSQHISEHDLSTYHNSDYVKSLANSLLQEQWPKECANCEINEKQNKTSMRENANRAYENYKEGDITLEIRPGNVCNFACQTCWPAASSRVTSFYKQAGFDVNSPTLGPAVSDTSNITNYKFLESIKHRIKDVVLLGGEPFYDKNCISFLLWATKNLNSNITLFTNTSMLKEDIISSYQGTLTIVSSIDAIGKPAEYIRFGTEWNTIEQNYKKLNSFSNVKNRVNITTSAYNFYYISDVIDFLIPDWPEVVSFGIAGEQKFREWVVPLHLRKAIIDRLEVSMEKVNRANIPLDQKQHAMVNCQAIIKNLREQDYNEEQHTILKNFTRKLDKVKNINSADYGSYLKELLND